MIYLCDIQPGMNITLQDHTGLKMKCNDQLSISISSRDTELNELFNIHNYLAEGGSKQKSIYTIDQNGDIELPIIGRIHAAGRTRLDIQNDIKLKILTSKLLRDPMVAVEMHEFAYYTIGESGSGRHPINRDRLTIIEAIAESGDLSLYGRRDNILVLRTEGNVQTPIRVDLTNTYDVYSSPAYYIQQNDVIYIEPNQKRINESSTHGNVAQSPMFWLSVLNFALSAYLILSR